MHQIVKQETMGVPTPTASGAGASYQYGKGMRRPTLSANQAQAIVNKINRPIIVPARSVQNQANDSEAKTPFLGVNEDNQWVD